MYATQTVKQCLKYRPGISEWLDLTAFQYNTLAAIYFVLLDQHPDLLQRSNRATADELERLTHRTARNPDPPRHTRLADSTPFHFRRAAMMDAIGAYRSFASSLASWRERQRKAKEHAAATGTKSRFDERPPRPPREWNLSLRLYQRMYKDYDGKSIILKLWDGEAWRWVRFEVEGQAVPEGWNHDSPLLVKEGKGHWALHFPITKEVARPKPIAEQMLDVATRICAIDLNIGEQLAVCAILTADGKVVATKFIGGGDALNTRRQRQLGRIYQRMSATGVVGKDQRHCRNRWDRVKALNKNAAHRVSRRIADFALKHGAAIVVFEDLRNFRPTKTDVDGRGKPRSRAANLKRSLWLRGKIQEYTEYKAKEHAITVCWVSPYDTSRRCSKCDSPIIRYDANGLCEGYTEGAPLMYCPVCGKRDNADRNAAINVGLRFIDRYRKA